MKFKTTIINFIRPKIMINIKNVSVHAFCVAIRWASINGYPEQLKDWTEEQSAKLQEVAKEYDRRQDKKYGHQECGSSLRIRIPEE